MKGRAIKWADAELAYNEARKTWPRPELLESLAAWFGRTDVSLDALNSLCKLKGWLTGRTGFFPLGGTPANKGRKGYCAPGSEKGHFRKGDRPHTYRGAGHESVDREGYVWIIIAGTNPHTGADTRRVQKHKWLWEQHHGPGLPGMS